MNIGILGAGKVAAKMVKTLNQMSSARAFAVASRSIEKAKAFAQQYDVPHAYGSYEDLVSHPKIDLIYIATPHSFHYEHMLLSIAHGKHVLCEKAFTINERQANEVFQKAEAAQVLVTEAMWTRYLPMRSVIDDTLSSGIIGEPTSLTANLGYALHSIPRLNEPALAGGALLDVGVYPINFALMVFGNDIEAITSSVTKLPTGVDASNAIVFKYKDNKLAVLHSTMLAATDRRGMIFGSEGYIEVQNINNCEGVRVFNKTHNLIKEIPTPKQISGFEFQVEACKTALENNQLECPEMPHKETLRVLRIMDSLRKEWGVVYPGEEIS